MPLFLLQVAYTTDAWAHLVKDPQDRTKAIAGAIEKVGGKIKDFWFTFGDSDIAGVLEFPDNVSAAAIAMAFAAGGACKSVRTTPLLTIEEGLKAMKKAGQSGYKSAIAGR